MNTLAPTAPDFSTDSADFVTQGTGLETTPAHRRSFSTRIVLVLLIVVALAGGIAAYVHLASGFVTTEDAFLEGKIHPVSPRVGGTVVRVLVDDNEHVTVGQPLVELDPADQNLAIQAAEADLNQARANLTQIEAQIVRAHAGVEAATARIAQNAAELRRAELDFHRMETLVRGDGVISQQAFETARAVFDTAQATGQSLLAERASAEAALEAARAQRAVGSAQVQKAASLLETAKLQASYLIVRAPNSGRVAKKSVEVGQRLQIAQPLMAVVGDDIWVVANFKENQLARLRAGQQVRVTVDALEGRAFGGVVDSFSPGTGAKFSLLPPDNSTGNFTKIVQRVPVKIRFAPEALGADAARLAPGLSTFVKVSVR
jgi:membrane fusion protein, multidrug efflux system